MTTGVRTKHNVKNQHAKKKKKKKERENSSSLLDANTGSAVVSVRGAAFVYCSTSEAVRVGVMLGDFFLFVCSSLSRPSSRTRGGRLFSGCDSVGAIKVWLTLQRKQKVKYKSRPLDGDMTHRNRSERDSVLNNVSLLTTNAPLIICTHLYVLQENSDTQEPQETLRLNKLLKFKGALHGHGEEILTRRWFICK